MSKKNSKNLNKNTVSSGNKFSDDSVINEMDVLPSTKSIKLPIKLDINFDPLIGYVNSEITLAMSPDSTGLFTIGNNVDKYTGISKEETKEAVESGMETPDDAVVYGMCNVMNNGDDIFFWTNGTRLAGASDKSGVMSAINEQLSHECLHLTRLILNKHILTKKGINNWAESDWLSIGDQDNDIQEESFATAVGLVVEQVIPEFIKMASEYIPELKNSTLPKAQKGKPIPTIPVVDDYVAGMKGMMKARMAIDSHFGNPSAKRMTSVSPKEYTFTGNEYDHDWDMPVGIPTGEKGTHFMAGMDNYAVPFIQEGKDGSLYFNERPSKKDKEAMRFETPEEARYFSEHYKKIAPMMNKYKSGGIIHESDIVKAQKGNNLLFDDSINRLIENTNVGTFTTPEVVIYASDYDEKFQNALKNKNNKNNKNNQNINKVKETENWLGNVATETLFDQIPYFNIPKSAYEFLGKGKPFTALSELVKLPGSFQSDAVINMLQDNPSNYSIGKFEENVLPEMTFGIQNKDLLKEIGFEIMKNKNLPGLSELSSKFSKLYNVPKKEITDFIKQNMSVHRRSYEQALGDLEKKLKYKKELENKLSSKNSYVNKQHGGIIHESSVINAQKGKNVTIDGKVYNTSSPEYKKLYYNNSIASIDEEGLPNMYYPEVEIVGNKKDRRYRKLGRDIATLFSNVAEITGVPGALRFVNDPKKNLSGALNTIDNFILSGSQSMPTGVIQQTPYKEKDTQAFLNTLDAAGLLTAGLSASRQPIQTAGKYLKGYKPINTPKQLPGSGNVDFSKYPSQLEAVQARSERLLSQKNKKGWNEQLTPELEERLSTAVQRHDVAGDYPGEKLGVNLPGRTGTVVSKDAISKGVPLTDPQKSMIASHETGHYYANSLKEGKDWAKYFDFSDIPFQYNYFKGKPRYNNYYNELRERAAQLKDYIAFKNNIPLNKDFKITRTQLDDALENYVKDTGLDNSMTPFIEALKKKGNISGFLKEMNKRPLVLVPAAIIGAGALSQEKKSGGLIHESDVVTAQDGNRINTRQNELNRMSNYLKENRQPIKLLNLPKEGIIPFDSEYNQLTDAQKKLLEKGNNLEKVKKWYEQYHEEMNPIKRYNSPGFKNWVMDEYDVNKLLEQYSNEEKNFNEALKNDREWYKNWYTKRSQLPEFKDIATERLSIPNEEMKAVMSDPININLSYWDHQDFDGTPFPRTFYLNPTLQGFARRENNTGYYNIDYLPKRSYINKNNKLYNSLITHEESHIRDFLKPQKDTKHHINVHKDWRKDKDLDPIEKVISNENIESLLNDSGEDAINPYYHLQPTEIKARLNVWRQRNNIDPLKKYTTEEIKSIMNEDLKKENVDKNIKDLYKVLGNDPEKLKFINDSYVLNKKDTNIKTAKSGGVINESDVIKYKSGGNHGGLDRWFAEKWVDVKTGKQCGRQEGEKRRSYPACRPSVRVTSKTPKTASELSSSEKEKFKKSKTSSQRINYQHKRNNK